MARYPLAFDTIERSNLQSHEKSALRKWWDDFKPTLKSETSVEVHRPRTLANQAVHVGRGTVEGLGIGGALGLAHANLPNGLDIETPIGDIPADAALGGVAAIGAIIAGAYGDPDGVAVELNNTNVSAFSVLGFRKLMDISAEIKARNGGKNNGTVGQVKGGTSSPAATTKPAVQGEDRILAVAEKHLKKK